MRTAAKETNTQTKRTGICFAFELADYMYRLF